MSPIGKACIGVTILGIIKIVKVSAMLFYYSISQHNYVGKMHVIINIDKLLEQHGNLTKTHRVNKPEH